MSAEPDRVLTVDEAAPLLRVNRKTLYAAIGAGQIPGVLRVGKTIRLSRAALLRWMGVSAGGALEETHERSPSEVD